MKIILIEKERKIIIIMNINIYIFFHLYSDFDEEQHINKNIQFQSETTKRSKI